MVRIGFEQIIKQKTTATSKPRCSMYGISIHKPKSMANVGKYSIYGAYGKDVRG